MPFILYLVVLDKKTLTVPLSAEEFNTAWQTKVKSDKVLGEGALAWT